jgi:hypothetical protein
MPWKTRYLPDEKIVEMTFEGNISMASMAEVLENVLGLLEKEHTFLVLGDCLKIQHNNSAFNIYDLPKSYETRQVDHRVKEAMILPTDSEARKNVEFYETVCRNRGYNVRVFETREAALDWLLK